MSRPCLFCKSEINGKMYCGIFCKDEFHKQQKRLKNALKRARAKKVCEHCKNPFIPRRRIDESFCSNECNVEFHKTEQRQKTAAIRLEITIQCPVCNCDFQPDKTLRQRYCSKKCRETFPKKIYKALQRCREATGTLKLDHAHKVLGYTPRQLQERIQTHPNWEAVKEQDWHLDHIFPIVAFLHYGIKDLDKICCLDNLQPLIGQKNCSKNDSYDADLFQDWLFLKGWQR